MERFEFLNRHPDFLFKSGLGAGCFRFGAAVFGLIRGTVQLLYLLRIFLRVVHEVLGHLLFEVKAIVSPREGGNTFVPVLLHLRGYLLGRANLRVLLGEVVSQLIYLRAELFQILEVAGTALNLFVDNETVKSLLTAFEAIGQVEIRICNKSKATENLLGFALCLFDSF